jgi:urease beta subunit
MRVQLEQRSHLLAGDFGWQAVGSPVELSPSPGIGPETIWSGRLVLPSGDWPKRLVVEEVERLSADGTFGPTATHERLVYTDIVPLSPDRFGVLTPSPASVDFGSVNANSGTADRTISVANTGNAPLQIGAVSLMGPDAAQFSILNDGASGQLLNVGGAASVTVRFAPTLFGSMQAQLDFPNDAVPAPLDVDLAGTGVGAKLDVQPPSINFGLRLINTTSAAVTLTLTNTGNTNLVLGTLAIGGADAAAFAIVTDCSGQTLAPGANTSCDLTFTPPTTGPKSADLRIPSNEAGSPQLVPLAGQGIVS